MKDGVKTAILTPFRNNERHIPKYIEQALALVHHRHWLRWVLVEGDSTDNTLPLLQAWAADDSRVEIVKCDTGKPHYGSVVHPERFEILAQVFNAGLEAAIYDAWADYVLFIPSAVIYKPDTLARLLSCKKDIISPMFWIVDHEGDPVVNANGLRFYDIWGFVREGKPFPPMGPAWFRSHLPNEPVQMDTTGGMMLYRAEVARRGARYTKKEVDHGFCRSASALGFEVWCDPSTHILHGER